MQFKYDPSSNTPENTITRGKGGSNTFSIDLNRDGYLDLISFDQDWPNGDILTNVVSWLYIPKTGLYVISDQIRADNIFSFPFHTSSVDDFNGDHLDDLYIATNGNENKAGLNGVDYLFLSKPDGSFGNGIVAPLDKYQTLGHGTTVGDINNDGLPDILVSGGYPGLFNPYYSFILYNLGNGSFTTPKTLPGVYAMGREFTGTLWASEIADLNNDGLTDIVTGHSNGPLRNLMANKNDGATAGTPATIFFQNTDGSYRELRLPHGKINPINTDSVDIKAFDADNDGDLDLVLSNYYVAGYEQQKDGKVIWNDPGKKQGSNETVGSFEYGEVQFFLNDGRGNFSDATNRIAKINDEIMVKASGPDYFQYTKMIDIDADGDLDLFFGNSNHPLFNSQSNIWINDGKASFTPLINKSSFSFSPSVEKFGGPWGIQPFDYDKDGDWDFVWDEPTNFTTTNNVGFIQLRFTENMQEMNGAFGGSSERDTLKGTEKNEKFYLYSGNDVAYGGGGNDIFFITYGNDVVYGDDGVDHGVFSDIRDAFVIELGKDTIRIADKKISRFGIDELFSVERIQFTDTMLALDTAKDQTAGSGYMLYKAAFNRTPDASGLGYWISKMDLGMSYSDVAKNFVTSFEFQTAFGGSSPSVNTLVTKLYNNVLNRTPDAGGLAFWQNKLSNEGWSTADVLGYFSTSGENVTNVTPLIANGIQYQPFVG
jgi:hypothetical protein